MSKEKNQLLVVVDPGYSALKIIINKKQYIIPSDVLDVTNHLENYQHMSGTDSRIISHCIENRAFIIGTEAQNLKISNEALKKEFDGKKDIMESAERFSTIDFQAQLITAIGYGLIQYSKETGVNLIPADTEDYDIFVAIPLPHDYYINCFSNIEKVLKKTHDFDIEIGSTTHHVNFTIGENRTICFSQTLCLLLCESMDDEGEIIPERAHFYENLPALILDGGQGTFGIVQVDEGLSISPANQESNTDFAMRNVYQQVYKKVLEIDPTNTYVKEFNLQKIFDSQKTEIKYLEEKDGKRKVAYICLEKIKETILDDVADKLIEHLCEKFNELLYIEQIIIGGGTGYAYADKLKAFFEDERGLKGRVHLTDNTFNSKKIEPVFAVAAGMYKYAKSIINSMN